MSIVDFCKDIPLVNVRPGIKKALFLLEEPAQYDAYVYKYTNDDTGAVLYIGYHVGMVDGVYMGTPVKFEKEMKTLMYDKDAKLRYEIVGFGSKEEMLVFERELIEKEKPIYNGSVGSARKGLDMVRIGKFLIRLRKGDFRTREFVVDELAQMLRHQCRDEQYDNDHLKEIEDRIMDGGVTDCRIVVLEKDRNEDGSINIIIDGNHTIQALINQKMGSAKIKVDYIPYHIASSFSEAEIDTISHMLNPDDKVIKKNENVDEVAAHIARISAENKTPIILRYWKEFFSGMNWTNSKINRALDKAKNIERENLANQGHKVLLKYKGGHNEKVLDQTVESHKNSDTHAIALSSGGAKVDNVMNNIIDHCTRFDDTTGKREVLKKNIFIVIHHPTHKAMDDWNSFAKKDFTDKLDYFIADKHVYEVYEMPAFANTKQKTNK